MSGADEAIMLCGAVIGFGEDEDLLSELLELNDIGMDRRAVDATTGASPELWGEIILSCIKRLTPFTVTIAFQPNARWDEAIVLPKSETIITWPIPEGYETAAVWTFMAGITSFKARGQLEDRMTATVQISPSGPLVITPGDPVQAGS